MSKAAPLSFILSSLLFLSHAFAKDKGSLWEDFLDSDSVESEQASGTGTTSLKKNASNRRTPNRKPAQESGSAGVIETKSAKEKKLKVKFKNCAIPLNSINLRFARDSRKYGVYQYTITLPTAAQFSFFVSSLFKSNPASPSRSEMDLTDAGTSFFLFTPYWHHLGLVGLYTDITGTSNNTGRGGFYYVWSGGSAKANGIIVPMIYPAAENNNKGRALVLWSATFLKRLVFTGSIAYIRTEPEATFSTRPVLGIEVAYGTRLGIAFDYNSSLARDKGGWQPGVEFVAAF
jgi:hypothetical protein